MAKYLFKKTNKIVDLSKKIGAILEDKGKVVRIEIKETVSQKEIEPIKAMYKGKK